MNQPPPPSSPSNGAAALFTALGGSPTRLAIVHELASHEWLTAPELCERVGVSRTRLFRHMVPLEDAGLLVANVPPAGRQGRHTVRWNLNRELVEEGLQAARPYLLGPA